MSAPGTALVPMTRRLEERIAAAAFRFDFYQAVRLLELLHPHSVSPGAGPDARREPVRFRSRISLQFPASDVHQVRLKRGGQPEMTVNFMGLAGLLGPLPAPFTELILATPALTRVRGKLVVDDDGQPASRPPAIVDFLDIFNHRLISLMYRVRKLHRPALSSKAPSETPLAQSLFALVGLGHPGLRNRMAVPDAALLFYAGLFAARPRSAIGLERILSDYFGVPAKIRQFIGRWRRLDPAQWTVVGGRRRRNVRLGETTIVGTRVWDKQTHIRVRLGPMPRAKFIHMLPGASGHQAVRDLIRFYLDPETTFSLELVLREGDVYSPALGSDDLLAGVTSWLALNDPPAGGRRITQRVVRLEGDY